MALDALLDAIERLPTFQRTLNTLPPPRGSLVAGGLAGSSDAAMIATLVRALPTRFLVVACEGVADAERWLADLDTLVEDAPIALYPAREGFGEAEPHLEVAGERVETLERLTRGELRVLLTTSRALLEKTRMPRALRDLRVELRKGATHRLSELASHLDAIGFERVPMVEDVTQFSIRGGILDIYSFGMSEPVRAEFWGDEIVDLRHFDLTSQRSSRAVDFALVLPVDGHVTDDGGDVERGSITSLFPPDTLLIVPRGSHVEPELKRTWDDAQHHIDLARRRGEDAPDRNLLFDAPATALAALRALGTITLVNAGEGEPDVVFPIRAPESVDRDIKQLSRLVRDGTPTIILCDNEGQAERLDELLSNEDRGPSPAALSIGVLDGGFVIVGARREAASATAGGGSPFPLPASLRVLTDHEIFRRERRIRRARRYITGTAALDTFSLKHGDYVVHLEHGVGIYRGIEDDLRRAEHHRSGGGGV